MKKLVLVAVTAAASIGAAMAEDWVSTGTVRWVATDGSDENGDGSEGNPYATINKAVSLMAKEDIVRIKPGTYTLSETPTTNPEAIDNDPQYAHLTIEGADPANRPVINGDGKHVGLSIGGMGVLFRDLIISNCVSTTEDGAAVVLKNDTGWGAFAEAWRLGFRFDRCLFVANTNMYDEAAGTKSPGAIYIKGGEFYDCDFIANSGGYSGGAVYLWDVGSASRGKRFSNCTFRVNSAYAYGGAIRGEMYGQSEILDCNFENNRLRKKENAGDDTGGALSGKFSLVSGSAFRGNYAYGGGGAIYSRYASPAVVDCVFEGNSCYGANWYPGGGAVYLWDGGSLTNCIFRNNTNETSRGGGLYFRNDANNAASMCGCTFVGNVAATEGGAVFHNLVSAGGCLLDRNVFKGNSAKNGGAINFETASAQMTVLRNSLFVSNSATSQGGAVRVGHWSELIPADLESCTFVGNSASGQGAAIYTTWATVGVTNCIFSANTAAGAEGVACNAGGGDGTLDFDHCFTEGDPKFSDAASGDYTLGAASPCRNTGVNLPWMVGATYLNPTVPKRSGRIAEQIVDIGCYEYWPVPGFQLMIR